MDLFQALAMGLLQGATEFIPVSSSGHLVLIPWLLGWPIPPVTFDALVHLGTLFALLAYFWGDLKAIAGAWLRSITLRRGSTRAYLGWLIVVGTVPAAVAGVALEDFFEGLFASPRAVSMALLGTALLLILAELSLRARKKLSQMTWYEAVIVGVFQALAIVPGISRSGATIAAGIFVGLNRSESARFSFLLSVPIIFGAGLKKVLDMVITGALGASPAVLIAGFLAALISGYASIAFLLAYVRRRRLYAFAVYCLALGILGLALTG